MSINKPVALVASVIALGASPLAAGHGALSFGNSTTSLSVTEPQMQAQASEAPAWHAGDRSVYDSSQGRVIAATPLNIASDTVVSPPSDTSSTSDTSNATNNTSNTQEKVPGDLTRMQPVAPTAGVESARSTANPMRYGYRPR